MKPKSKKDQYTVECENEEQTRDVLNFIDYNTDRTWSHWRYVTRFKDYDSDINEFKKHSFTYISFEEWKTLTDDGFVLPEKWCVKWNIEIGRYYAKKSSDCYLEQSSSWEYLLSENYCNDKIIHSKIGQIIPASFGARFLKEGYTEITFEQFKENVLKEKESEFNSTPEFEGPIERFEKPILEDTFTTRKVESKKLHLDEQTNKYREIIGYKLFKEEYMQSANLICLHHFQSEILLNREIDIDSDFSNRLKKAGVLDLWFEPVYKLETITLKSGVELSEKDIDEVRGILIDRYAKL